MMTWCDVVGQFSEWKIMDTFGSNFVRGSKVGHIRVHNGFLDGSFENGRVYE